jgi:hypothetical protein
MTPPPLEELTCKLDSPAIALRNTNFWFSSGRSGFLLHIIRSAFAAVQGLLRCARFWLRSSGTQIIPLHILSYVCCSLW